MRLCQNSLLACLSESLGHRSGWGPHRFTWFGYMVLISVLACKGIPLSWSRSWPSISMAPWRVTMTTTTQLLMLHHSADHPPPKKKTDSSTHTSNPPAPFFWKGRATVVCFSFRISSFHTHVRVNLAQWLVRTANNCKVPGSDPALAAFVCPFTRGVAS